MNIHEAKTHFSKLVAEVEQGREVVITRAGRPVAKLIPYRTPSRRVPGGWEGRVRIAPDFDEPDEDVVAAFEGGAG
ncbi:MAG TPA: type II toxin-antitoxin system prevent-host-death family antitoxin [Acidimicrobiales bacterium]|nr:type II toxin-antitoxin system prevent-host-death family antitoxin [Acidimicrobiales bacterium]